MRIRALTSFAGPRGSLEEGEEQDVSEETGRSWMKERLAEKVKPQGKKKGQKDDLFEDEED